MSNFNSNVKTKKESKIKAEKVPRKGGRAVGEILSDIRRIALKKRNQDIVPKAIDAGQKF